MPGPPPAKTRRRANKPATGDWKAPEGTGWQHGPIPKLDVLGPLPTTEAAWDAWMKSWWAFFWTPGDLPQLQLAAALYDQVYRGMLDVAKLTPVLDKLGITPKGRQDLRWQQAEAKPAATKGATATGKRYGHLKSVAG